MLGLGGDPDRLRPIGLERVEIMRSALGSEKKIPSSRAFVVDAAERLIEPTYARAPSASIIFAWIWKRRRFRRRHRAPDAALIESGRL
jgi:hypothetical protein